MSLPANDPSENWQSPEAAIEATLSLRHALDRLRLELDALEGEGRGREAEVIRRMSAAVVTEYLPVTLS